MNATRTSNSPQRSARGPAITGTSTDLATFQTIVTTVEEIASTYGLEACENMPQFQRAIYLAEGVNRLRAAITDGVVEHLMRLQGSPLGFLTDKDRDGGYPSQVVKECFIEATLRGLYPVGNEWNIISGKLYVAKEGYRRKVAEIDGLSDLDINLAVPLLKNGGAVCAARATWKYRGAPCAIDREIPVRVNQAMGVDAILGKAERKMLAQVYKRVMGSRATLSGDDEVIPASVAAEAITTAERLRHRLDAGKAQAAAGEANPPHPDDNVIQQQAPAQDEAFDVPPNNVGDAAE